MKRARDCIYVNHSVRYRCRRTGRVTRWGRGALAAKGKSIRDVRKDLPRGPAGG
jgi:hypothetical protein